MLGKLTGPTTGHSQFAQLFSDEALIEAGLRFELALADACAAAGLLSSAELQAIVSAAERVDLSIDSFAEEVHHAGTLAIPLVAALKSEARAIEPSAAEKVHLGSTSQDLADTVNALISQSAAKQIVQNGKVLGDELAILSKRHQSTLMVGRTITRRALPITFGLKVANWLVELVGALESLHRVASGLALQLAGPTGTMINLGGRGAQIQEHMARVLALSEPSFPWHTNRQQVARLSVELNLLCSALGKIAQDVALLGQDEIGELAETHPAGRGGSSAMAHKQNPTSSQQALLAIGKVKSLSASILSAPIQEYERSIQGWQAELGIVAEQFIWSADALALVTGMIQRLQVNQKRMNENLADAGVGTDTGESERLVDAAISLFERSDL